MNRQELQARKDAGETLTPEEEQFLSQPESTPESTPPTDPPPASVTDQRDRYIGVLEQTLRENNRQIQELMAGRTTPAPAAPAGPTPEQEKQDFYNEPVKTTRQLIREELTNAIAPLNEFVRGLKIDGSPYANMMAKFKADARFSGALADPHVLSAVERIMESAELNEVNMQSAIVHASGLKSMGLLGTIVSDPGGGAPPAAPAPTPAAPQPSSTVIPPHVRPSAAPVPAPAGNGGAPRRRALTENERRLMRENGFKTEAEYWTWLEMDAADVAGATFDKPKPAGAR